MNADDLARAVANELGPDVAKNTDAALRGEGARGWHEAAVIGGFVIEVCRFAWEIYKDTKSKPELKKRLLEMITRPSSVSEAKSEQVIDSVVDRITAGAA